MNRRKFIAISGGTVLIAGGAYYLSTDKNNFTRNDIKINPSDKIAFKADEKEILYLASLAPSGHNTQPWFVKYIEPYHWIICNDKSKWLTAVDPTQRETILSIGAFLQNLEYAASNSGYNCQFDLLATTNQDEEIMAVKLIKANNAPKFNIQQIKERRIIRSAYLNDVLKKEDVDYLIKEELDFLQFIPNSSKEYKLLNEHTIEANRIQAYRDTAENELANWIRFSSKDAKKHCDGLTVASMEITGISGWALRNFYKKEDVMKDSLEKKVLILQSNKCRNLLVGCLLRVKTML